MQRMSAVVGLDEAAIPEYVRIHEAVWPTVLKRVEACHIRNYSIYLHRMPDRKYYLFSYLEYHGTDWHGDMARMAADPETQRWWKITQPMQQPLADRPVGSWWSPMTEVFHVD